MHTHRNLLLLSNSRNPNSEYLAHALAPIAEILAGRKKVLFIPYAGVTIPWDGYVKNVKNALASLEVSVTGIHTSKNPLAALAEAEAVMVGGGNTFNLLHHARRKELLVPLRNTALAGKPYIGWSAGSNLASPSIRTTNDMPIVDPGGFDALGLIDYQLNPHYTELVPPNWQGETREQRLNEFCAINPTLKVLGLPEGNWLRVEGERETLHGPHAVRWFGAAANS